MEMKIPPIEERMASLLKLTAKEVRPCRACAAMIYLVPHNNGKVAPYTVDGVNHFLGCPEAERFRRAKK